MSGVHRTPGNKNAALPMLAASLLPASWSTSVSTTRAPSWVNSSASSAPWPRAAPVIKRGVRAVTLHIDAVEFVAHRGQQVCFRHQGRVNARLDFTFHLADNGKQFDDIAHLAGIGHIQMGDLSDALHRNLVQVDFGAVGKRGKYLALVGGVMPKDVEVRGRFRKAFGYRLLQGFLKLQSFVGHAAQNIIAGTVQDAVDAVDMVRGKAFTQCFNDGHRAGYGRLEAQLHPVLYRRCRQFRTSLGQQHLVRRDHVLAGVQRFEDEAFGRFDAAEPACSPPVFLDRGLEVRLGKIRPEHGREDEFAVGALPEQEIAQPQLAARPDDQVGIRDVRQIQGARDGGLVAEGLLEELEEVDLQGRGILIARAEEARDLLPETLRDRNAALVDVMPLYRTVSEAPDNGAIEAAADADYVTFTSASTVKKLIEVMPGGMPSGAKLVSIGPITSDAAREAGLEVAIEAGRHDIDGLLDALLEDLA